MTLVVRYMRLSDIPTIVTIDELSFNPSWSAQAYHFEISESHYSHMIVLEEVRPPARPVSSLERIFRSIIGGSTSSSIIVGYGGLWNIANEAHISTIAVHPKFRGNGYGEVLLAAMCARASRLQASYVILEVRVSNGVAQNLYRKFGFETKTTKARYYQSDGEDAYEMRLNLVAETKERVEHEFAALIQRFQLQDDYTNRQPARR